MRVEPAPREPRRRRELVDAIAWYPAAPPRNDGGMRYPEALAERPRSPAGVHGDLESCSSHDAKLALNVPNGNRF